MADLSSDLSLCEQPTQSRCHPIFGAALQAAPLLLSVGCYTKFQARIRLSFDLWEAKTLLQQ
jgi:hypothetical protein